MPTGRLSSLRSRRGDGSLRYVSDDLRNDREVVLAVVSSESCAFEHASEEKLRNDREFVLTAVGRNGLALQYVPRALRRCDVVRAAVDSNRRAVLTSRGVGAVGTSARGRCRRVCSSSTCRTLDLPEDLVLTHILPRCHRD